MTSLDADILVLEALRAQASGIRRNAKSPIVGARAGVVEDELTQRLAKLEALKRRQNELPVDAENQEAA